MSFFDTKEEVLDVQLTQFGKRLLSVGQFRPVYYEFFDDDVLYNSEKAGFQELQNETEERILNKTPKLKTQHLTSGVETHFSHIEEFPDTFDLLRNNMGINDNVILLLDGRADDIERLDEDPDQENQGSDLGSGGVAEAMSRHREGYIPVIEEFRQMHLPKRNYNYNVQEKILLYSLANQEVSNPQAPSFDVVALDSKLIHFEGYQHFTSSGIVKNIPQFKMDPRIELVKDLREKTEPRSPSEEEFFDLTSSEVIFRDNTKIQKSKEEIVLDIQELNTIFKNDNFRIEIFEITGLESNQNLIRKIDDPREIRSLFHIKTDNTISSLYNYKTEREKNYQDRSRN